MAAIEKALNDFLNSGSLKAAVYRANAIFGFSSKVLASLAAVCWLSTAFISPQAVPSIDTSRVSVVRGEGSCLTGARDYYDSAQSDQGFITFDLQADLTPLFNWNVKVLFLYLSAEYSTATTSHNTAVLWDKIVMRGEKTQLDLKSIKTKYYFRDESGSLSGGNITLTLSWNVMPNMGHLTWIKAEERHSFTFPAEYYSVKKRSG
jgi:signal peptidase complex subunit 3